jgi:integrase/recombinase XerD
MTRFLKFNQTSDMRLNEITVSLLKDYEVYFVSRGNKLGTINSYMKGIKAIYNKAIEEDEFKPLSNPFTKYKIPRSKTQRSERRLKIIF